jgi:gamma-glutamyltranspeptidase/glutathione hydrolase
MRVTPAQLLDRGYLSARARLIDLGRAQDFGYGTPPPGGTVYLAAADEHGMMVSLIQSNYMGFGSGIVVPGTGISMQNRGTGFSLEPDHPNLVGGGKRPFHTIIPGFATRGGAPYAAFGVMGGPIQPQAHLQTLVRMIDYRGNPQAVLDAPRWKVNGGLSVDLEVDAAASLRDGLRALGHSLPFPIHTWISAPVSSSCAPSTAISPDPTRGATGRPPATDRRQSVLRFAACLDGG